MYSPKESSGKSKSTATQRLTSLLEYFSESSDDHMRTYVDPDKTNNSPKELISPQHSEIVEKLFPPKVNGTVYKGIDDLRSTIVSAPDSKDRPANTNTALVRIADQKPEPPSKKEEEEEKVIKLVGRAHERHHFVKINHSSISSCSSPTGLYSEIAFVLWVNNKHFIKYSGSSERYRIVIAMLYDAEADLWCASAKLVKRGSYSTARDEEEGHISNRLCSASELKTEVKKMLLYFGVSPQQAYRLFRRNLQEKLVVKDSGAGIIVVETTSHDFLMKELEKAIPFGSHDYGRGYGEHGYPHQHRRDHHGYPNYPTPFAKDQGPHKLKESVDMYENYGNWD